MFETLPQAMVSKIARRQRLQEKGRMIAAYMGAINESKDITVEDVKAFMNSYSQVFLLLLSGSLETAYSTISAIAPDGVMVTVEDKQAILFELGAAIQAES